jgi:hypothetical protein
MEATAEFRSPFAVYMWQGDGSQRVGGYVAHVRYGQQTRHKQCTYNVTLRSVRVTTVAVEKQQVLHILSVCL